MLIKKCKYRLITECFAPYQWPVPRAPSIFKTTSSAKTLTIIITVIYILMQKYLLCCPFQRGWGLVEWTIYADFRGTPTRYAVI